MWLYYLNRFTYTLVICIPPDTLRIHVTVFVQQPLCSGHFVSCWPVTRKVTDTIPAYNSRARRGAVTSHLRRFPQSSCTLSFPLAEILQLPQKSVQMPDFMEFLRAGLSLSIACSPGTVQSPFQAQTRRAQGNIIRTLPPQLDLNSFGKDCSMIIFIPTMPPSPELSSLFK